jgi:hypothetical protein
MRGHPTNGHACFSKQVAEVGLTRVLRRPSETAGFSEGPGGESDRTEALLARLQSKR